MASNRIKIEFPSDFEEDLNGINDISIDSKQLTSESQENYQMDLATIATPENLKLAGTALIAVITFMGNVNSAVSLVDRIRKFFEKKKDSKQSIKIQTPKTIIRIDASSSPEVYHKLQEILESVTNGN